MTLADRHALVTGLDADESGEVVVAHLQPGVRLPPNREIVDAVVDLTNGTRATVLDLSDVTLIEPAGVVSLVDAMVGAAGDAAACCVVARRSSGRRLLRQWHVDRKVCLFGSVGDALQARVHSLDGYGLGWSLAPSGDAPS